MTEDGNTHDSPAAGEPEGARARTAPRAPAPVPEWEREPERSSFTSTRTDTFWSPPDPLEAEERRREREGGPGPPPSWLPIEGDTRPPGSGPRGFRQRGVSRAPRGRRGDILDAALRLFVDSSYTATTVQDIAEEARASVGSVYHHFDGKEDIAASIYVAGLADYHRGLLRELHREHDSAEAAVKGLVRNHLRWVERNPELARFLFTSRDREVVSATGDELFRMNQRLFHAVQRWMDRWIEAGDVQRLPIGLLHAVVLGPSQEFCRHWVARRMSQSIDEAEPVLAEAAWKAVRA